MSNRGIWSDLPGKRTKILNATCTPLYAQAAQHALAKGRQASRRRRGMALSIGGLAVRAASIAVGIRRRRPYGAGPMADAYAGRWQPSRAGQRQRRQLSPGRIPARTRTRAGRIAGGRGQAPARPFTVVTAEAGSPPWEPASRSNGTTDGSMGAVLERRVPCEGTLADTVVQCNFRCIRAGCSGRPAGSPWIPRWAARAERAPSSCLCLALRPSYSVAAAGSPRSAESRYKLRARASGKRMSR